MIYIAGNYVLNYLYNQPKLAQFVIQGLVTLFARITNLGWFDSKDDDFVFRNVIGDITKFLQGQQADHCMIGVQLLSQLTCEMNQVSMKQKLLNFVNNSQIMQNYYFIHLEVCIAFSTRLLNSSGARRLFLGKFSTEYKLITVATIIDFFIVSQHHYYYPQKF